MFVQVLGTYEYTGTDSNKAKRNYLQHKCHTSYDPGSRKAMNGPKIGTILYATQKASVIVGIERDGTG